jgi:hypothetical protein
LCIPLECQFLPPIPVFWKYQGQQTPHPIGSALPKRVWAWEEQRLTPPTTNKVHGKMHQVHCSAKRTTGLVVYCFLGQVVRVTNAQRVGIPEKTTINQILKKLNWVQRLHHLTTTQLSGHLVSLWCKRGHNGLYRIMNQGDHLQCQTCSGITQSLIHSGQTYSGAAYYAGQGIAHPFTVG